MLEALDADAVRRWYRAGLTALEAARAEINSLNVFPVADADTGTNLYLTLSFAALQYRYGVNRVFVVAADKLAVRELKVGDRLGDRIEILSGVKAGEQVAVTDVDKLADGGRVTVNKKTE